MPLPVAAEVHARLGLHGEGFLSLTPAPPPFSAMNSTPADSKAAHFVLADLTRTPYQPQP
jgi:hypothetical protein